MTRYLYLDPDLPDALFVSSEPPAADAGMWWEVADDADPNRLYIGPDGQPAILPPRPGDWAVFDAAAGAWLDPRTPAEIAAALNARRAATALDKSDLLIRLALSGILSPAEAEGAAAGAIPASMAPMMAALPPEAQMAARIKWAGDTQISRTHPVIVAAAYALGITDEALDMIFGVAP